MREGARSNCCCKEAERKEEGDSEVGYEEGGSEVGYEEGGSEVGYEEGGSEVGYEEGESTNTRSREIFEE